MYTTYITTTRFSVMVVKRSSIPHPQWKDTRTVTETLPYVCDVCKEGFAFKSELSFHRTVHRTVSSFHCVSKGCGKSFKSSNELNKHAQKHLGVTWDCGKCDYLTDDRRNLRAHSKKHLLVGKHKCLPCEKNFRYFMQLKLHRAKPECLGNVSD